MSLLLKHPGFLQQLPRGWSCHLDVETGRIYYHHAELNESVWFAVQCTARRSFTADISANLRSQNDQFRDKFGVSDLYFAEGERIMLISSDDDVWWEGEVHGKVGIFPAAFVKVDRCSPIVELIEESIGAINDDSNAITSKSGGADADSDLIAAMSMVQLRSVLNSYHLPWHDLSPKRLRQYCQQLNNPNLQNALFVSGTPPRNNSVDEEAGPSAGSLHGPLLTEYNYTRFLPSHVDEPQELASLSQVLSDSSGSSSTAVVVYAPTPSHSQSGTSEATSPAAGDIARRPSLNISGTPRLFSVQNQINEGADKVSPAPSPSKMKKRTLQRSPGAVKPSETAFLTLRTNSAKTREQAMASPARMSALQRVSTSEGSVLNAVDTESSESIKEGYLNILKTSTLSLLSQAEGNTHSSLAGANFHSDISQGGIDVASTVGSPALNSMLHTWHNRFFRLTAKTLAYTKRFDETPKPHNMWTLVGAKIRWVDKTNIHFESTVAPASQDVAAFGRGDNHLSVAVILCGATQRQTNEWFEAIKRVCVPASSDVRAFSTLCRRGQVRS